jgi:hypothetical protein
MTSGQSPVCASQTAGLVPTARARSRSRMRRSREAGRAVAGDQSWAAAAREVVLAWKVVVLTWEVVLA